MIPEILPIGAAAPDFDLSGAAPQGAVRVRLADFHGHKHILLVFYPADNTSG